MQLEIVNILHFIFLFLDVFGILLVRHSRRYAALTILLGLQAILITFNLLEETAGTRQWYLVTPALILAFGPAFFLFVRQVVRGDLPPWRELLLHFLPVLLVMPFTRQVQLVILLGSVSQLIYLLVSLRLIFRYRRLAREVHSDADTLRLRWLAVTLWVVIVMMLQDIVRLNLQPYLPYSLLQSWYTVNTAINLLITSFLVYKSVRQPRLFEPLQDFPAIEDKPDRDTEEAKTIFGQIDALIRERELYKISRLSLRDLNDETGLGEKQISWAINAGAGQSFCDYINQLRLQAITAQLDRPDWNGKILDLALEMGFSAKSTFNTVFKNETGMTPTAYAKAAKAAKSGSKVQNTDTGRV